MLKIGKLTVDGLEDGLVTDNLNPRVSFSLESDRRGTRLERAVIEIGNKTIETKSQLYIPLDLQLKPFETYAVRVTAYDDRGESCTKTVKFETGRLDTPWKAKWITDTAYRFIQKKTSPRPMAFRKDFAIGKEIKSAKVYATAIGIYRMQLNGKKIGKDFFAPGFTSYENNLQYQVYDVAEMLGKENVLTATVAGGWAVGAFGFQRKNKITAPRQAFLCELRIQYADGTEEIIATDPSWQVSTQSPYSFAEFYDGEIFDARLEIDEIPWKSAGLERVKIKPKMMAQYGAPVREQEHFAPISTTIREDGEIIYDFGQNLAGGVKFTVKGRAGQILTIRHAEILEQDGSLCTRLLRTAKAQVIYVCRNGEQTYLPQFTYMGFRYAGVKGISPKDIRVEAVALYSDMRRVGDFKCSNELVNKFHSNSVWGAKSNFVDIPTDCPQRDERMGWTGDIAVFSPVAAYNFDTSRFFKKWLKDVAAEQGRGGGIPTTVPRQGFTFPATMARMAVDTWGDACILVPWAEYRARGDQNVLAENYQTMKAYVEACVFWARLLSVGKNRYIWGGLKILHFGDWVAPGIGYKGWLSRFPWTATASLANTSGKLAEIAHILGKKEDAEKYRKLCKKVCGAYVWKFTDGNGKLKNEFQTAYVLPLAFHMFGDEKQRKEAVENLVRLVRNANYCVGTGFPGTPHVLFALADNGKAEEAYQMLLNTECPSWLYEVKMGATTIWERWDAVKENGIADLDAGDMISFNHYASGAAADFLYRRVAGIEAIEAGYRSFRLQPVLGGGLSYAKASVNSPYGIISSAWKIAEGQFKINFTVPVGTSCTMIAPSGHTETFSNGSYEYTEAYGE